MGKFKFMEVAIESPANRGHFMTSKEAIERPFSIGNRFTEFWRSMFLYSTDDPNEEEAMFGNFYVECDSQNFQDNKNTMLDVADYLYRTHRIPYHYMDFFMTNRSIWLTVPAKVFGCFGSKHLHKIYRKMAEDVQRHLDESGTNSKIDLSIYKWNGLIHSLGSFLPQKKRWVTKFSHSQLEESFTEKDILEAEYENFALFEEVKVIETAQGWFHSKRKEEMNYTSEVPFSRLFSCERTCMSNLEKLGTIDENRNLHIYSYSLYLKELGYDTQAAMERVESVFEMDYAKSREAKRTVKSAIEGDKHFNCAVVKQLLNPDIFDCESCSITDKSNAETFLVPRIMLERLHEKKAHYDTYKWLLKVLHNYQVLRIPTSIDLKGEKHKKLILSRMHILKEVGLVTISLEGTMLTLHPVHLEKEAYRSHIVVPVRFIHDIRFEGMKSEIKLLLELWRVSLLSGNSQKVLSFNVKTQTLLSRLGMSGKVLHKHLHRLKQMRLVFGKQLFVFLSKDQIKTKIKQFVEKVRLKSKGTSPTDKTVFPSEIHVEMSDEARDEPQLMQGLVSTSIVGFLSVF